MDIELIKKEILEVLDLKNLINKLKEMDIFNPRTIINLNLIKIIKIMKIRKKLEENKTFLLSCEKSNYKEDIRKATITYKKSYEAILDTGLNIYL